MASYKRKREIIEDSDEESPSYGKQILPVANLPNDFSGEPMDGMQYLFLVRRDARQLPGTVRVANPYEKTEVPLSEQGATERLSARPFLPTEDWRQTFESRFQNFRKNFTQPTIYIGTQNAGPCQLIPNKKDRDMWWAFLSGRPISEWSPASLKGRSGKARNFNRIMLPEDIVDDNDLNQSSNILPYDEGEGVYGLSVNATDALESPGGTPSPLPLDYLEGLSQPGSGAHKPTQSFPLFPHEENFTPREPTTELIKLIDERYALHLLMYFTHWMNLYVKSPDMSPHLPTESHARWIFALLSRIDDYLSADDTNLLRNLARSCLGLLKHIKQRQLSSPLEMGSPPSNKMKEASCWIIITIIVSIWKQRDLWMDAEDMIKRLDS
ncbi:survival motor neuron interacting protein 1-domain-containing protein [Gymnopilus junonius]|uniref:Survival motor neuron interacting protein 1-domain-containing protein n=1 Tax=Gymnopilus junonius TaxID=109634 RepID=A0A9P5NZ27_GYMJU|nr:survival motor neuron interacting protein 1-domain-containing protein [Gymnopilus junonius]